MLVRRPVGFEGEERHDNAHAHVRARVFKFGGGGGRFMTNAVVGMRRLSVPHSQARNTLNRQLIFVMMPLLPPPSLHTRDRVDMSR